MASKLAARACAIARAVWREVPNDHLQMVSAGLAYYGVFGLLPALAAASALFARIGGAASLQQSAMGSESVLPAVAGQVVDQFVRAVPEGLGRGWGLAINLVVILYTAQRAASGLLTSLNIVYDVQERRGRLHRSVVALGIGAAGIGLLFTALAVLSLPALFPTSVPTAASWLRWPVLALLFAAGLALLFRYAPARESARWRRVVSGAVVATLLWLAASALVSVYADHLGSFGLFYGSLGGVAVVLLWFYAGGLAVLTGAEIDAVLTENEQGHAPGAAKSAIRKAARR